MSRRSKNAAAKIADILAKFEIETDKPIVPETDYQSDTATAVFIHVPNFFQANICKECEKPFAHNQIIGHGSRVGFCSDACRRDNWKKTTGIDWFAVDPGKEPWDGDPPLIISPEQFDRLKALAEWFTRNQKLLETRRHKPLEEQEENREDSQEYPDSPPLFVMSDPFGFDVASTSESENQYPVEAQTNLQSSLVLSTPQQNLSEDDPFGF